MDFNTHGIMNRNCQLTIALKAKKQIDPNYPVDPNYPTLPYPTGVFSILQSNRKFYHIYTLTIVIHKSRNLIGTEEIAQFGPK